jgi:putative transposase
LKRQEKLQRLINTEQSSQFTSRAWISTGKESGAEVSMDGKGRWLGNVFIERLWRSVKHEGLYLWGRMRI